MISQAISNQKILWLYYVTIGYDVKILKTILRFIFTEQLIPQIFLFELLKVLMITL